MTTLLIYPPVDVARYIPGCYPTHAPWCSNDGCGHTRHLCRRRVTEICPWWNTPWHTHTFHCLGVMKLVLILSSLHQHQTWVRGHDVVALLGITPPNEWYLHWPGAWCLVLWRELYSGAGNEHSRKFEVSQSCRRPLLKPLRNYFNLLACPLWSLHQQPIFKSTF